MDKDNIQIQSEDDHNLSLNVSYEDNSCKFLFYLLLFILVSNIQKPILDNTNNEKKKFLNDIEYPLNKNTTPDLFSGNFEQLNNNFNDDLSENDYINRNFDTNFDEIYESLTYYVSAEK